MINSTKMMKIIKQMINRWKFKEKSPFKIKKKETVFCKTYMKKIANNNKISEKSFMYHTQQHSCGLQIESNNEQCTCT